MYHPLKNIFKRILTKRQLYRLEPYIRSIYALCYFGQSYYCNICGAHLSRFVRINEDQLCPKCGSLSRNRRLWDLLSNEFLASKLNVLDFSPSRSLYRKMKRQDIGYVSSDLSGNFIADQAYDIRDIIVPNDSFDLIICYHVLEHIDEDHRAMSELYRILRPNGVCLIQTPFKDGEIYENSDVRSPEGRLKHFGQEDHVRIYSVDGLKKRLQQHGFNVEIRNYHGENQNKMGFKAMEHVLVARKV